MDSLRHWLKKSGLNPAPENRGNLQNKKIHALESELKSVRKELEKKDEIITILKKSIGLQSLTDKHDFIDNNRAGHSVSTLCRILNVSKSDYYATKNRQKGKREESNQKLLGRIISVHEKYPAMGLDSLYHFLKPTFGASRALLHRLMKKYNIHSVRMRAYKMTTNSKHNKPVSPNLLKNPDLKIDAPNTVWVVTYIPTQEAWTFTPKKSSAMLSRTG